MPRRPITNRNGQLLAGRVDLRLPLGSSHAYATPISLDICAPAARVLSSSSCGRPAARAEKVCLCCSRSSGGHSHRHVRASRPPSHARSRPARDRPCCRSPYSSWPTRPRRHPRSRAPSARRADMTFRAASRSPRHLERCARDVQRADRPSSAASAPSVIVTASRSSRTALSTSVLRYTRAACQRERLNRPVPDRRR
jgi:hypothetical protein